MAPWTAPDPSGRFHLAHGLALLDEVATVAAARDEGFDVLTLDAESAALYPHGVLRAMAERWMGRPGAPVADIEAGRDAVGEGRGAHDALDRLATAWDGGAAVSRSFAPDDDAQAVQECEVLARWFTATCEEQPRVVVVRNAQRMDEGTARVLRSVLVGRPGGGLVLVLLGLSSKIDAVPTNGAELLIAAVAGAQGDERVPAATIEALPAAAPIAEDGPDLPVRGTAVELYDILRAFPGPVPVDAIGQPSLSRYRDRSARGAWLDLESMLDAGVARIEGDVLFVRRGMCPGRVVPQRDREQVLAAIASVCADRPALAAAVHLRAAIDEGRADAEAALLLAEAGEWSRLLSLGDSASGRIHAARRARRYDLGVGGVADSGDTNAALDKALVLAAYGLERQAEATLRAVAAEDGGTTAELRGQALYVLGRLQEGHDAVAAAATLAEAARLFEHEGLTLKSARVFAQRALAMAAAGAGDRALKELRLAMDRALGEDAGDVEVIDVRILAGHVFRDAGHRDKARQALQLAVDKAALHARPDRQAEALVGLARFWVEALPPAGSARGEAMAAARDAADSAVGLARGLGRLDLQAEAESVLAELAARVDDHAGAIEQLLRIEGLYERATCLGRALDAALRRGRLLLRDGRADDGLRTAAAILQTATRRRLVDRVGQAQMLRGEALDTLGRKDEALAAFSEAHRVWKGLGIQAQADAAEQRARQLVARGRAQA